jgi:Fic-DOC domain mobile mystery protein B
MKLEYPERATPIDRSESDGLKIAYVRTRDQLNKLEGDNIVEAEAKFYSMKLRNILSDTFLRKLHREMFGNVWNWAGKYRTSEKNIGVQPWEIAVKVRCLCEDVRVWIDSESFSADEIAARFHHRLVFIHPFANGNGRHARLAAKLLLTQELGQVPFSWGQSDLMSPGTQRSLYIQALKAADNRDYSLLMQFVRS